MNQIRTAILSLGILCLTTPASAQTPIGLRVSNETAPPGSVAQLKLSVTEPKPIIHASMFLDMGFSFELYGIALYSPSGTAGGVAYRRSGGLVVKFNDPGATAGTDPDYPLLTLTIGIKPNAQPGTVMPVSLNLESSEWLGPLGVPYAEEAKPGSIEVGGSLAVTNVVPGGGVLEAGETFRIFGVGFQPEVRVQMDGMEGLETTHVSSTELLMRAGEKSALDGKRIRIRNKDNSSVEYFSYLRGARGSQSAVPVLEKCEPIYPMLGSTAVIGANPALRAGQVAGIALLNPNRTPVTVSLETLSPFLQPTAHGTVSLGAGEELVRSLEEVLGVPNTDSTLLRVMSPLPVRLVTMLADSGTGEILPLNVFPLAPSSF